jgi:hypothetical protein
MHLSNCPACGRAVSVLRDGELCTHGPGPDGAFVCPGSGDPELVQAAQHLSVDEIPSVLHHRSDSTSQQNRKGV